MNGIDFLADTNFLIHTYEGNSLAEPFLDYSFAVSYITEIELLGVFSINTIQKKDFKNILEECVILEMNQQIKELCIHLKQKYKIKIPDTIIAATAIV